MLHKGEPKEERKAKTQKKGRETEAQTRGEVEVEEVVGAPEGEAVVGMGAGLLLTTRHRRGGGGKFSFGPLANQNFSVASLASISLDQKISLAPSAPLKTQHSLPPS